LSCAADVRAVERSNPTRTSGAGWFPHQPQRYCAAYRFDPAAPEDGGARLLELSSRRQAASCHADLSHERATETAHTRRLLRDLERYAVYCRAAHSSRDDLLPSSLYVGGRAGSGSLARD